MDYRSTSSTAHPIHGIIVAGGQGVRLGGVSKADLDLGGRLLDRVLEAIAGLGRGHIVVVAPDTVEVRPCVGNMQVSRTMEEPPGGGPLAGIGAGVDFLAQEVKVASDDLVVISSVDLPGIGAIVWDLVQAAREAGDVDGAIAYGGAGEPFDQYLLGVYRFGALCQALAQVAGVEAGFGQHLHSIGVRRALRTLSLIRVPASEEACRDIDSPEDLQWWHSH
ncbi:MAG: NTP transferase domain-containing protein [Actinomycetaceae bacterium]|nr:NTP transferase domain-containing protein [Actinomycetaceae bacterium]